MSNQKVSRRRMLGTAGAAVAGTIAGAKVAEGQNPARDVRQPWDLSPVTRMAPREELVNLLEFEEEAKKKLPPQTFGLIAGGDRALFERITLRPRMAVSVVDLDLSLNLFGDTHFTPILIAPIADQKRFHPDGELATAKGAAAGRALMIVSSRSSVALADIATVAKPAFWYQVYASDAAAKTQARDALRAGAKAIVITVGASPAPNGRVAASSSINWSAVQAIKQGVDVPVLVKGIATPAEATAALQNNVQGLIASNFGGLLNNKDAMILALPAIVDAVGGKVPVLTDGAFRRGTDILKALAFGAQGVLLGRPVIWGLAAYGEQGVRSVVEMAQTELARYMGMCGKVNLKVLDRSMVKVHAPIPVRAGSNN
jgi:4-hydroxymandelate oxidase